MTTLNEQEQTALKEMLDSALFKKAESIVLDECNGPIFSLLMPEQAMALAQEKGVRNAFRVLRKITEPRITQPQPRLSGQLIRTKHDK